MGQNRIQDTVLRKVINKNVECKKNLNVWLEPYIQVLFANGSIKKDRKLIYCTILHKTMHYQFKEKNKEFCKKMSRFAK